MSWRLFFVAVTQIEENDGDKNAFAFGDCSSQGVITGFWGRRGCVEYTEVHSGGGKERQSDASDPNSGHLFWAWHAPRQPSYHNSLSGEGWASVIRLAISLWQTQSDIENHVSHRRGGKDAVLKKRAIKQERQRESRRKDDKEQSARGKVKRRYEKVNHPSVLR